jgi:hypothetical protein
MGQISAIGHLLGALRRAAGRVFITFLLTLVVVAALSEGIHYVLARNNGVLTHVVSALMAVGWAIAVSLLVLVFEVIKGLVEGARDVARDVEREVGQAGQLVQGAVQSAEHHGERK